MGEHKSNSNVLIVGAGFTGLAAGYELSRMGHRVTVLERNAEIG